MPDLTERAQRILELADDATPEPWFHDRAQVFADDAEGISYSLMGGGAYLSEPDARLAAEAHQMARKQRKRSKAAQ